MVAVGPGPAAAAEAVVLVEELAVPGSAVSGLGPEEWPVAETEAGSEEEVEEHCGRWSGTLVEVH